MALQLGETAPDFTVESTEGTVSFHEWLGDSWAVLFSHPADYTPVCTTELGAFAKRKSEFDKRGAKLIGVSVDPLDSHTGWAKDIETTQGAALNYPLLADDDQVVGGAAHATVEGMPLVAGERRDQLLLRGEPPVQRRA